MIAKVLLILITLDLIPQKTFLILKKKSPGFLLSNLSSLHTNIEPLLEKFQFPILP